MLIVPLQESHRDIIASLHMQYLRTPYRGRAGRGLLSVYYRALAQNEGACGYVAEKEGSIVGYVCGVWDPGKVRHMLISKYWLILCFWGFLQALFSLRLIKDIVLRLGTRRTGTSYQESGYELRPIVVDITERGSGLAARLVDTLIADALKRGYSSVYLYTEDNNDTANAFYHKAHFRFTGTISRQGQKYNRFERSVDEPSWA